MKITGLDGVLFSGERQTGKRNPDRSHNEAATIKRARKTSDEFVRMFNTPEVKAKLKSIPKEDKLFYDTYNTSGDKNEISGPKLYYCRGYSNGKTGSSLQPARVDVLEFSIDERPDTRDVISWLDDIMTKSANS